MASLYDPFTAAAIATDASGREVTIAIERTPIKLVPSPVTSEIPSALIARTMAAAIIKDEEMANFKPGAKVPVPECIDCTIGTLALAVRTNRMPATYATAIRMLPKLNMPIWMSPVIEATIAMLPKIVPATARVLASRPCP